MKVNVRQLYKLSQANFPTATAVSWNKAAACPNAFLEFRSQLLERWFPGQSTLGPVPGSGAWSQVSFPVGSFPLFLCHHHHHYNVPLWQTWSWTCPSFSFHLSVTVPPCHGLVPLGAVTTISHLSSPSQRLNKPPLPTSHNTLPKMLLGPGDAFTRRHTTTYVLPAIACVSAYYQQ